MQSHRTYGSSPLFTLDVLATYIQIVFYVMMCCQTGLSMLTSDKHMHVMHVKLMFKVVISSLCVGCNVTFSCL